MSPGIGSHEGPKALSSPSPDSVVQPPGPQPLHWLLVLPGAVNQLSCHPCCPFSSGPARPWSPVGAPLACLPSVTVDSWLLVAISLSRNTSPRNTAVQASYLSAWQICHSARFPDRASRVSAATGRHTHGHALPSCTGGTGHVTCVC